MTFILQLSASRRELFVPQRSQELFCTPKGIICSPKTSFCSQADLLVMPIQIPFMTMYFYIFDFWKPAFESVILSQLFAKTNFPKKNTQNT